MPRVQLALNVADLDAAVGFYNTVTADTGGPGESGCCPDRSEAMADPEPSR